MDWARQSAAVIPCFNEAAGLGKVLQGVRQHLPTAFVVDDGSTDETADLAAAAGAEVIRHSTNRGKGAALRSGWNRARERGFTWALTLDGDGQHAPEDIPAFFACAGKTGAALVVGDRMQRSEAMPWLRRATNRWMSRQLSGLVGAPLNDSQCGFRLINVELCCQLKLTTCHFEIESEQLVAFAAAGQRIEFVPVQVIYQSQPSKIQPVADGWRWIRWWWRERRAARMKRKT